MTKSFGKTTLSLLLSGFLSFAFAANPKSDQNKTTTTEKKTMESSAKSSTDTHYLNFEKWRTPQGTEVYFVQAKEIPLIDLDVTFDAGSTRDGTLYGLASMTAHMLTTGIEGMDENELLNSISDTGASINAYTNSDMTIVSIRSMSKSDYLNPAIALFSKILTKPTFPQSAFTRIQKQVLAGLELDKQSAGAVANKAFTKALYGNNPYGHTTSGTEKTVKDLNIDDVKSFYKKYYVAKNATITIVGDLSSNDARAISQRVAQGLPQGEAAPAIAPPTALDKPQTIHIPFDSQQTTILIGSLGIKKEDPLFFPLLVGNQILGGSGLTSLLFTEVRKERGLAYGANSGFSTRAETGSFIINTKTRSEKTNETIQVINKTLDDYIETGPTQEQLDAAKKYLIGSFPLSFANNSSKLNLLNMITFYHLPENYLNEYIKNIDAVTAKDIQAAFKQVVHTNDMLTITVGATPPEANTLTDINVPKAKTQP